MIYDYYKQQLNFNPQRYILLVSISQISRNRMRKGFFPTYFEQTSALNQNHFNAIQQR